MSAADEHQASTRPEVPEAPVAPIEEPGTGGGNGDEPAPEVDGTDGAGSLDTEVTGKDEPRSDGLPSVPLASPDERPSQNFFERNSYYVQIAVDAFIVGACVLFVFLQLGPRNIIADTTPSGGDMGAHVWGPAYLRDHLLTGFRLSGWTPDWYAGFPAYQFYMVIPSLIIVVLDVGIASWGSVGGAALLGVAAGLTGMAVGEWGNRRSRYLTLGLALLALLFLDLPYGVSFKLVAVSGALSLPVAAYMMGRLASLRFPSPAFLAIGTLPFLFYRGFSIYGGNIASTLAGEFAFSISLSLALVYIGVVIRGLDTGRNRAQAAILLALCGLCHIIPAFFVLTATALIVLLRWRPASGPVRFRALTALSARLPDRLLAPLWVGPRQLSRARLVAVTGISGLVLAVVGAVGMPLLGWGLVGTLFLGLGAVLLVSTLLLLSQSVRWLLPVMVVGGLLSSFWVVPFYLRSDFVNDMGWEKIGADEEGSLWSRYSDYLWPHNAIAEDRHPAEYELRWAIVLAFVGLVLSLGQALWPTVRRWINPAAPVVRWGDRQGRFGILLGALAIVTGLGFVFLPQTRLWNGRILPFYYLTAILLALLGVAELLRLLARRMPDARTLLTSTGALGALTAILVVVGLPLGVVWFDEEFTQTDPDDPTVVTSGYSWPSFLPWKVHASPDSFIDSWAAWNFRGYEKKDTYREYYEIVQTMDALGEDSQHGCGRAMWEYSRDLDRYGTPMALMLLPYWTDSCIGSMEGLFFESSVTTPYHFLVQTEMSAEPSSAQRYMPYTGFNFDLGVQHLQLFGVKYYMATSPQAQDAAAAHHDLTLVAESGPWEVYEVAGSELVEGLPNEPAVLEGVTDSAEDWLQEPLKWQYEGGFVEADEWEELFGEEPDHNFRRYFGPSVDWFLDPDVWDVMLARGGPQDWPRVEPGSDPAEENVNPATVSEIEMDNDSISFDVDEVGTPVLVKASYFPNWQASGADGPWRVAPNLMVVVPTDTHVELTFGRTTVDWLGYLGTLAGVAGVVALALGTFRFRDGSRGRPRSSPMASPPPGPTSLPSTTEASPTGAAERSQHPPSE